MTKGKRDLVSYLAKKSVDHLRQNNAPSLVSAGGEKLGTVDDIHAHNNPEEADILMVLHAGNAILACE